MTALDRPEQAVSAQLNLWQQDHISSGADPRVRIAIRRSRKARRLILQTLPPRTVEVIVPIGVSSRAVAAFVQTNQSWIDRAGNELLAGYPESELLPTTINFRATDQRIDVRYQTAASGRIRFDRQAGSLVLHRNPNDPHSCSVLLRRWLLNEARHVLKPWLLKEAQRTGLTPKSVAVRLQKTRWGSCSSRGAISLNAALMLVKPELVRYLLVHELCHLTHMSHSQRYWKTVASFDPAYRHHDRQLGASITTLPAWLTHIANGGSR